MTSPDPVFISRLDIGTGATRVAIKDLIDVAGTITTAGCKAVERRAKPATADATLLAGIRAAVDRGEVTIVGKTNLHELAFGADGINAAYGTPINPIDPARIPGGSSSGSAVAVANAIADVALGSDTGGSIRMPAACCGIVGLKTTWGRVPLHGVWPLAPFLDTIGPMARTVSDVILGMELLEPGFARSVSELSKRPFRVGRAYPSEQVLPAIDRAVDAALDASSAEVAICNVTLPFWAEAQDACLTVLIGEAWLSDGNLLDDPTGVSDSIRRRLQLGSLLSTGQLDAARSLRVAIRTALSALFANVDVIAIPTLPVLAPALTDYESAPMTALTRYANIAGLPALSMPVSLVAADSTGPDGHLPASLQLIGAPGTEALVCAVAMTLER